MPYTHTEMLDNVKSRGMIPTNQNTFTAERFLVAINDAMTSKVLPLVLKFRENFYQYDVDTAVNATGEYPIPSRAIGAKLENLALLNGTEKQDVAWCTEEEQSDTSQPPAGVAAGALIKRNSVWLVPATSHGYSTFRQGIYLRPAKVVAQTSAAQITAINTSTKVISFASCPAAWTTANIFEFVQAKPHFDTLGFDLVITALTSTTMTFSAALSSRLVVGDWVSLSGETPVIQCPEEMQGYLAQEAANYCLKGQSDEGAYKAGLDEAERLKKELVNLFTPRIEKEGKKLVNRSGMVRRGY